MINAFNPNRYRVCFLSLITLLSAFSVSGQQAVWDFDPDQIHGYEQQPQRNDITAGELLIDPPTLENLGFRWYIEGDSNGDATVKVAYREKGANEWREGLPMLRINQEIAARHQTRHFRTENLFAGSVLFLQPDTEYEVRFTMYDPDGGAPEQPVTVTTRTRSEPQAWDRGRTLNVYPKDWRGSRRSPSYSDLMAAYNNAQPGDIIFLHPGIHKPAQAPFLLTKGGQPDKPIVFRGAGRGVSIIQGLDPKQDLFRIPGADHLMFEHLTLRTAEAAIRTGGERLADKGGPGASWLTVRHSSIEDVRFGIFTYSENSMNWYIADNIITGRDQVWYPRPREGYMDGSHTGVNLYGQGHVICFNTISRFSDSLAIANYYPPSLDIHKQSVNIDFYNNDLSFAMDDTIEADYGCHNIRVYNNLCYNTHTALSVQPAYGGPVYLIRNVAFGITSLLLKWNMAPSGAIAYHNTLISAGGGFRAPLWSNGHLRNNLILAGSGGMISTGTIDPQVSSMDYNGWYHSPQAETPIRWTHGKQQRYNYPDLASFTKATGYEANGIMVDYSIFVDAEPTAPSKTYEPNAYDLRLTKDAAARNAGTPLANINDGYTGSAPDLGAIEFGQSPPHYGVRE